jgi:branched-chain amino acid transport system permease protein
MSPGFKDPSVTLLREQSRRPWARRLIVILVLGAVLLLLTNSNSYRIYLATSVCVFAIAALGQDWLIGQAGQVSLGGAAFMGIGAFTVAGTEGTPLDQLPIQLVLAGLIAAAVGLIVGLPAMRLRGIYLLLTTLALQFIMSFILQRYQGDRPAGYSIGTPKLGPVNIQGEKRLLVVSFVCLLLAIAFARNLHHRAPGRYWAAMRESEAAAASLGINVPKWKLLAWVGSSAQTAMAGVLFAYVTGLVTYSGFSFTLALSLTVMVFFGGMATVSGPIVGAIALTLLPQGLQTLANDLPTGGHLANWFTDNLAIIESGLYGLALLLVLLWEPRGLVGVARRLATWGTKAVKTRSGRSMQGPVTATAPTPPTVPLSITTRFSRVAVEASRVTVSYPNGAAGVRGASLTLPKGAIVALLGRNGAGKTSMLRALAGFPRVERTHVDGVIRVNSQLVAQHGPALMRSHGIVLVPERDKVFPSLTIEEHLRLAGCRQPQIEAVLVRFPGLVPLRDRPAGLLSGGQRQLLALAAATAANPTVLLIDEPSLGLSPVATQQVLTELRRLRDDSGTTVLLTEQVTETLDGIADMFYVMDSGAITMSGTADALHHSDVREAVMGR